MPIKARSAHLTVRTSTEDLLEGKNNFGLKKNEYTQTKGRSSSGLKPIFDRTKETCTKSKVIFDFVWVYVKIYQRTLPGFKIEYH